MRISQLKQELDDLVIEIVRSVDIRDSIHLFDPMPLAAAWLEGEDVAWINRFAYRYLSEDDAPSRRAARLEAPFDDGTCAINPWRRSAVIHLMPPFLSPAATRRYSGSALPFAGFGPLGAQRFSAFHEIGHYFAQQTGYDPPPLPDMSPAQKLRREALADGFAVGWAVAKGADPKACVRDVGVFRACAAVDSFSPDYVTHAILEPAAEIGLACRRAPDPRRVLDEVHHAANRVLPPRDLVDAFAGLDWEDANRRPHADRFLGGARRFLVQQTPWTREDETRWWARLVAYNPEAAPVLLRVSGATLLAHAASHASRDEGGAPYRAALVFKRLHSAAAAEGSERARRLKALMPSDETKEAQAASFAAAAKLFDRPLDTIIRQSLERLAEHAERSTWVPENTKRTSLKIDSAPKQFVLIDIRENRPSLDDFQELAARIAGPQVDRIAVVADTRAMAESAARMIRIEADMMRASIHPLTDEDLAARRQNILAAVRAGKMMLVGPLPEFREEALTR